MKRGFTLVELSIVLVIIGLLIGGVLVGQSLIGSARVSKQVRQIQQLDIAVDLFRQKFRYLPGDVDRNHDIGYVNTSGQGCYTDWNNNPEVSSFYPDLNIVSFSPQTRFAAATTGTGIRTSGAAANALGSALFDGYALFASPCPSYNLTPDDNYYELADYRNSVYLGSTASTFQGSDGVAALAFDNKIDDGNVLTGNSIVASAYNGYSIFIKMGKIN